MYIIKLLDNKEYDNLPYRRARTSLGCADPKTKVAYVRRTGVDLFDLGTIQHEIEELVAKVSPHEEDGIRYKGKSAPEYQPPPPPKLPTAQELFSSATQFGKTESPLAYGAREGALSDLSKGTDYYSGFQPTSFEDALANQYFQNVWPDTEKQIKHGLSLSGIESSPVLASLLGKEYGNLATSIGTYLSDLGNTRATNSLNARLNIDPYSTYGNYLNTDVGQSNEQANLNYQYAMAKAQSDYNNAMASYQKKQAGISGAFGAGGAGIGALLAGALAIPTGGLSLAALPAVLGAAGSGAALGSSIGGYAAPMFGGSANQGMGIQDALAIASAFGPGLIGKAFGVGTSGINPATNIATKLDSGGAVNFGGRAFQLPLGF